MFKSIVVAFDGSTLARRALDVGVKLAKQNASSLGIIYVVNGSSTQLPEEARKMGEVEHLIDPAPIKMVNLENAPASMMNAMARANADSQAAMFQYVDFVVEQARKYASGAGVATVEVKTVLGDPADEVVKFAGDRRAELIVSGSRGLGKLKSLVLGSVSHKILQLAECSCMIVK